MKSTEISLMGGQNSLMGGHFCMHLIIIIITEMNLMKTNTVQSVERLQFCTISIMFATNLAEL